MLRVIRESEKSEFRDEFSIGISRSVGEHKDGGVGEAMEGVVGRRARNLHEAIQLNKGAEKTFVECV